MKGKAVQTAAVTKAFGNVDVRGGRGEKQENKEMKEAKRMSEEHMAL
jgi:hypothetical protein